MNLLSQVANYSLTDGLGLLLFAQQAQVVAEPPAGILVFAILVFLLALLCGAFDDKPQHPIQRTFDDYMEELRRESEDYLDKIDRLYRKR